MKIFVKLLYIRGDVMSCLELINSKFHQIEECNTHYNVYNIVC